MIVFIARITGSVCIYLEPRFADNLSIRRDFHFRGIHDWVNDVGAVINFIKKHSEELAEFSQQALSSLETADSVVNAIGSQAKSMIQDAIKDEEWAPNAPITIEGGWMMNEYGKKGPVPVHIKGKSSTKPLIDTGALRQNCQYVIRYEYCYYHYGCHYGRGAGRCCGLHDSFGVQSSAGRMGD